MERDEGAPAQYNGTAEKVQQGGCEYPFACAAK